MLWTLFYWLLVVLLIISTAALFALFSSRFRHELRERISPSVCSWCEKKAEAYRFEKVGHCMDCNGLAKRLKRHYYLDPSTVAGSYGVNNYFCSIEKCDCTNMIFGDPICAGCYQRYEAGLKRLEQAARDCTEQGSQ